MKFLLDTHTLLWVLADDPRLGERAKKEVLASDNQLFFSLASYWEICIKVSLGKLLLIEGWSDLLDKEMARLGIETLAIRQQHLLGVLRLPFHHRDPFDRLLVSQAECDGLTIITADRNITRYDIPCVF
jgi:PIN domain nuclease of toxin-antitoxin system